MLKQTKNKTKQKIDKTQENRCRLYDGRDETTNHMISECSKLFQKGYETKYELLGKVIH